MTATCANIWIEVASIGETLHVAKKTRKINQESRPSIEVRVGGWMANELCNLTFEGGFSVLQNNLERSAVII